MPMFLKLNKLNLISLLLVLCIMLSSMSVFGQEDNINTSKVELSRFEKYDIKSNSISNAKLGSNAQESEAYTYIKNGLIALDINMNIEALKLSRENFDILIKKILIDNPDIFYIRGWSYSYSNANIVTSVTPKYDYDKNTIINMRGEIDSKVDLILNSIIKDDMTEFQKELAIHDYLVLNSKYDPNKLSGGSYAKESHSIYGTLVRGVGVCESYAEAFKLLLNKVGIESMVVISTPAMNHAWNIVNLDGKYYHVDVTWDDPTPDREGMTRYSYLNLTDTKISTDHYWDAKNYPTCNSKDYSYLWDMSNPISKDNYIYYSLNQSNAEYMYKLNQDTLTKTQITSDRAPYFCIIGDWIYFSNYSKGAKIHKINIDGSRETLFHNVASMNIYSEGNRLYFTEYDTKKKKYIEIESEAPTIVNVDGVTLNKSALNLLEGDTSSLVATVSPTNATNKNISWKSSNPSVATVDNKGNIVAIAEGTTEITATTEDGEISVSCNTTVSKKAPTIINVESVILNEVSIDLLEGDTSNLIATVSPSNATNKNTSWKSSDPSIATVDNKGNIVATGEGETDIIVTTEDGNISVSCNITVSKKAPIIINVESVTLNEGSLDLLEGDTSSLVATVSPANATNKNVSWKSSNTSVATVDNKGNIVAIAKGKAIITSKTIDGNLTANCNVTVIKDEYDGYKKWKDELNVPSDKKWTIKFNQSFLEGSISSGNVYVTDISGNVFDNVVSTSDNKTIIIKPPMNYESGKTYYLYIENIKSHNGKELQSGVKMKFTVK